MRKLSDKYLYANNFGLALDDEDNCAENSRSVYLSDLFVPPHISADQVTPSEIIEKEKNETQSIKTLINTLKDNRRIFILGDPGSGKSTLFNWLTYSLANYHTPGILHNKLGKLVPFNLVLRELPLKGISEWADLWEKFVDKNIEITKGIQGETSIINQIFNSGQSIILIDGLDEVSDIKIRQNLAEAILDGMKRFPRCRFLISSRIIGFSQSKWLRNPDSIDTKIFDENAIKGNIPNIKEKTLESSRLY